MSMKRIASSRVPYRSPRTQVMDLLPAQVLCTSIEPIENGGEIDWVPGNDLSDFGIVF